MFISPDMIDSLGWQAGFDPQAQHARAPSSLLETGKPSHAKVKASCMHNRVPLW